jgi:hypothetical protein
MGMVDALECAWTAYHECGHAVAAMALGAEGWLNLHGTVGSVEIENRNAPKGAADRVYSYAGAVAEALARLGFEAGHVPHHDDILAEMAFRPPSEEDMQGIGSLADTGTEFRECVALICRNWQCVVDLVGLSDSSEPLAIYFPHMCRDVAARIVAPGRPPC